MMTGFLTDRRARRTFARPAHLSLVHGHARPGRSLLSPGVDTALRALDLAAELRGEGSTALRRTIEEIWKIVAWAARDPALDTASRGVSALFARRELVRRSTATLASLVRRGVAAGVFQPRCSSWAIEHLPYAIVAGGCAHWMLGISAEPSLRASTAVAAMLEVLEARPNSFTKATTTTLRP